MSAVVLQARGAKADPLPGGGEIEFEKLLIHEDGDSDLTEATTVEARDRYFNLAHCVCSDSALGSEQNFGFQLHLVGETQTFDRPGEIWLGTMCNDTQQRPTSCFQQADLGIGDIDTLATPTVVEMSIATLMHPDPGGTCEEAELEKQVWMLVDTAATGTYDYVSVMGVLTDTQAPPVPSGFSASGAETAVQVNWDAPTNRATDIYYYQALCSKIDGTPALATASHEPRYQGARDLCGLELDVGLTAVDSGSDAGAGSPAPEGLLELDPSFICGEAPAGVTSIRIEGLENSIPYRIAVIAIDRAGNADGVYFSTPLTPLPVTDFWEDLQERGSAVEGGFCLVAQTYGDGSLLTSALRGFRDHTLAHGALGRWLTRAYYRWSSPLAEAVRSSIVARITVAVVLVPVVALALAWHVLSLPGLLVLLALILLRKRLVRLLRGATVRLERVAPATAAVMLLAAAGSARAQTSIEPYWEDPASANAAVVTQPSWHLGFKIGPYVPDIDEQQGDDPGPYEAMFGSDGILPVIELDWLFSHRYGQIGLGGSVGLFGRTASAYAANTSIMDPDRPRADGDDTTFRLLPLSASLVYRLTSLDDNHGFPLVPYLRAGLSYYIWWITAPSGKVSRVYDPDIGANKARGASLGFQGSLGISLRAERIDASAARSMRDSGIEHAGFYAEVQLAKVDGFGKDSKLSVGDTTWFAGFDFEF
jgi:hypothetical protein